MACELAPVECPEILVPLVSLDEAHKKFELPALAFLHGSDKLSHVPASAHRIVEAHYLGQSPACRRVRRRMSRTMVAESGKVSLVFLSSSCSLKGFSVPVPLSLLFGHSHLRSFRRIDLSACPCATRRTSIYKGLATLQYKCSRNCQRDERRSLGVGVQALASNPLQAAAIGNVVVVSVAERSNTKIMSMYKELSVKSRVRGDSHARFFERVRVKLPRSTRPMIPGLL